MRDRPFWDLLFRYQRSLYFRAKIKTPAVLTFPSIGASDSDGTFKPEISALFRASALLEITVTYRDLL